MNSICYSPLPIESYCLDAEGMASVRSVADLSLAPAVWNLTWLSIPTLDNLPGAGKEWHKVYLAPVELQGAIVTDVYEDEVLYRKLCMSPVVFLDWWRREDHTIYDAYEVGGKDWVDTVTRRAELTVARMSNILGIKDNVIAVKFGRAA